MQQSTMHGTRVERLRLRRAPLAAAAVWFAVGIVLGRRGELPASMLVAALVMLGLLAAVALRWALRIAWVPVAGVWVVLGAAALQWTPVASGGTTLLPYADGLSRDVVASVEQVRALPRRATLEQEADSGVPWEAAEDTSGLSGDATQVDLAVRRVEDVTPDVSRMVPAEGTVRVALYGWAPELRCGDEVKLALRMRQPDRYRDPGAFDYGALLAREGVVALASAPAVGLVVAGHHAGSMQCRLRAAQAWSAGRLAALAGSGAEQWLPRALRLRADDVAMLDAMLFGDRTRLDHRLRVGFERTGSFHLFVVSGLHVALLAAGVYWLCARLRAPLWLTAVTTLLCAGAYAALTGFGQPAQRALAMTAVFLAARLLARERDMLNALGAAALAMLAWRPGSLFEASLQMSVLAIVAIGGLAVPLAEWTVQRWMRAARRVYGGLRWHEDPAAEQLRLMLEVWGDALVAATGWRWMRRAPALTVRGVLWAVELALIGTVVELVMVQPMAVFFHRAAVFALPANMVVVPVIAVLAPLAVATFAASVVSPWLAMPPAAATAGLLHGITAVIAWISHGSAADVRLPGPVWWVGLLAVSAWGTCCWLVRRGPRSAAVAALVLPVVAVGVLWPEPVESARGRLEVTALDVGQGDSVLVVAPGGETMLVDAGGPVGRHGTGEVLAGFDVGEEVVSPYLWSRRLRRLDVLVLTHAHTDHMGGMPAVLAAFRPRELWVSTDPDSALYRELLAEAARVGTRVLHLRAGAEERLGAVDVRVLSPAATYANAGAPKNDDSLAMELRWEKASVLLEGDAERPSEDAMLAAGELEPVTLLKVGHHGSRTSSNPEFVQVVRPRDAVISVGRNNTFGHPRGEVIARLADAGARVYRTDAMGLVTFLLGADGSVWEQPWDGQAVTSGGQTGW